MIERLTPVLRKAIQSAILENVARSFSQAQPELEPAPAAEPTPVIRPATAAALVAAALPSDASSRVGVITTAEELDCWNQISTWVREVRPDAPVAYRDSKSYFTIHQSNLRKWCVRLNVAKAPFWVAFRHVPADDVRRLAPGIEIIEPASLGDSRVALRAVSDLSKLRAAIIAAYEREAARVVDDGPGTTTDEPSA